MGINRVQFQPGLSMSEFIHRYGTEAKCYRALYKWRWPEGYRCPSRAGSPAYSIAQRRKPRTDGQDRESSAGGAVCQHFQCHWP